VCSRATRIFLWCELPLLFSISNTFFFPDLSIFSSLSFRDLIEILFNLADWKNSHTFSEAFSGDQRAPFFLHWDEGLLQPLETRLARAFSSVQGASFHPRLGELPRSYLFPPFFFNACEELLKCCFKYSPLFFPAKFFPFPSPFGSGIKRFPIRGRMTWLSIASLGGFRRT